MASPDRLRRPLPSRLGDRFLDLQTPRVTVILPVRNDREGVRTVIAALERQTLPRNEFEIVVGDDGSVDGSVDGIETPDGWVRGVSGAAVSSSAGRNRAAALARAPVLAFCDSDCRPAPDWLEQGIRALEPADMAAGAITLVAPRRPTVWTVLDADMFLDQERLVGRGLAVTANLFVRRELFERIGGFDDALHYGGDSDFVVRARAAGARLVFAPGAVVEHPTRDTASAVGRKVWVTSREYAARETREGRRPSLLRVRSLLPVLAYGRQRRRAGRTLGLSVDRLSTAGNVTVATRWAATAVAYGPLYYLTVAAQVQGLLRGRRSPSTWTRHGAPS
jgi:GT2 family glycosyltransferase